MGYTANLGPVFQAKFHCFSTSNRGTRAKHSLWTVDVKKLGYWARRRPLVWGGGFTGRSQQGESELQHNKIMHELQFGTSNDIVGCASRS
jgi:hypothetical protein